MKTIAVCFIVLLCSCTNNSTNLENSITQENLRSVSTEYENSITWVDGIKTSSSNTTEQVLAKNATTTLDYAFHTILNSPNIYPYVKDFTTLNTESIQQTLLVTIENFLEDLKTDSIKKDSFSSKHQYLHTVTEYTLEDYPQIQSYFIGTAHISNSTYEIPIKLLFEKEYAHCTIYWTIENAKYKIVQIDIGALSHE